MKKISATILAASLLFSSVQASEYDANEKHPFGKPNPEAHKFLSDFAFAIGKWKCISELPNEAGEIVKTPLDWQFNYILNGRAVQDYFDDGVNQGMGIRQINPADGKWYVAYHSVSPHYANAMWDGSKVGNDIVLDMIVEETTNMRLSFYNIQDKSFEWKGEVVTDENTTLFWHISCDNKVA